MNNWWDSRRRYRLPVVVDPTGGERFDRVITTEIDLVRELSGSGLPETPALESLRLVEVDQNGTVIDRRVPFQFDSEHRESGPGGDPAGKKGKLAFLPAGRSWNRARCFHLYYDTESGSFEAARFASHISLTDNVAHEGQESYRIETDNATYFYHKRGAGFAGMLDSDGNDWISHHPEGGSAGNYRGIPNLVYPEGCFHPGSGDSKSTIIARGPLRLAILSETTDGGWACLWEIYPTCATLSVLRINHPYWFLYEGTPGGRLDLKRDFCVRSDGKRIPASESWEIIDSRLEWVYFVDDATDRVLYLISHDNHNEIDAYWPMEGNMTVFGFGRKNPDRNLNRVVPDPGVTKPTPVCRTVPSRYSIGFAEGGSSGAAEKMVCSVYRECVVSVGKTEAKN